MENNSEYCIAYTNPISVDSQWEFVTEFVTEFVLQQAASDQISEINGTEYVL